LELILANRAVYQHKEEFFCGPKWNVGRGALRVAGLIPNPGGVLRRASARGGAQDPDQSRRAGGSAKAPSWNCKATIRFAVVDAAQSSIPVR